MNRQGRLKGDLSCDRIVNQSHFQKNPRIFRWSTESGICDMRCDIIYITKNCPEETCTTGPCCCCYEKRVRLAMSSPSPLDKLLQRFARQFASGLPRPPDAAASHLGRELARHATAHDEASLWRTLTRAERIPPCLPHAFMSVMIDAILLQQSTATNAANATTIVDFSWLSRWMLQTEQFIVENAMTSTATATAGLSSKHLLDATIRAYAVYVVTQPLDPQTTMDAYRRLQLPSSRMALLRAVLAVAFSHGNDVQAPKVLSPFLAVAVLGHSKNDKASALQVFCRAIWMVWTNLTAADARRILDWMTTALTIHLAFLPQQMTESRYAALELAESWLSELAFLAQAIQRQYPDAIDLTEWFREIVYTTLPRLAEYCDMTPVLQALQGAIEAGPNELFRVDDPIALRLGALTLASADPSTREGLLDLLALGRPTTSVSRTILQTVATICSFDEDCQEGAYYLSKHLEGISLHDTHFSTIGDKTLQLIEFVESNSSGGLVDQIAATADFANIDFSATQQIGALLFGTVLLNDARRRDIGMQFLAKLLSAYPHLGINLLPVVLQKINACSYQKEGILLQKYLQFMCGPLLKDPYCAQEIWSLISSKFMPPDRPLTLRVVIIRLFPKLFESNKRLYRRVIDLIGTLVTSKQVEIRLAVAATLCDLAKDDLIRDLSDGVIGWLQGLLTEEEDTPMHSLLVYYAIMSLHYLVLSNELDFDVVIKVLKKRLCNVIDFEEVSLLTPVVQEALVILLGDGECDEDIDDAEVKASRGKKVSPQVSGAVRTLVRLGQFLELEPRLSKVQERIRRNIYESLSRYSVEALGLDRDGILAFLRTSDSEDAQTTRASDVAATYAALRDLALGGAKRPLPDIIPSDSPLVKFARKVLVFEEDTLGSAIWRTHGKRHEADEYSIANMVKGIRPGSLTIMPLPAQVTEIAVQKVSPGSAIATLLSADGSKLSAIRDNGDTSLDTTDPLFIVFALQGYLHIAASILSNSTAIGEILTEVGSWYEVFVSPDVMYLAFATLSIYIPHDLRETESTKCTYVEELSTVIKEAYKSQRFQKADIGKICLSLSAVSSLRNGSLQHVEEIVPILEQSVRGYGGRQNFGCYYGLALIGQSLSAFCHSAVFRPTAQAQSKKLYYRICLFLVEELISCHEDCDVFLSYTACLKSGNATAEMVASMSQLEASSISLLMTKSVTARYLFISSAVCLPGMASINEELHLASLRLMESFEWGPGKGLALPPMLRACYESELFTISELSEIYGGFAANFEQKVGKENAVQDKEGLEDIFYAYEATATKSTSHIVRRTVVGNRDLFDEDGRVLSLIAAFVSIAPCPCLGATYFTRSVEFKRELPTSDHESIVQIIRAAATSSESPAGADDKYSDMGIILMALLASMRDQPVLSAVSASLPTEVPKNPLSKKKKDTLVLDFDKMPSAHTATLLGGMIDNIEIVSNSKSFGDLIEKSILNDGTGIRREDDSLSTSMAVLECITLPGQFAKSFVEPLIQLGRPQITNYCVSFLCAQLRGRRRAAFDGHDYAKLALEIANAPLEVWDESFGASGTLKLYVESLPNMVAKFPSDSTQSALENTWWNCVASRRRDPTLVAVFLSSMKQLLSSSTLSTKVTKAVRQVYLGTLSDDLLQLRLETIRQKDNVSTPSLLEYFIQGLAAMPLSVLEECDYLNVNKSFDGFDAEIVKVLSLTMLMDLNYFGSENRDSDEATNIALWLTRKLSLPYQSDDRDALRLVITIYSARTAKENTAVKCTRLLKLLEVLLLTKKSGSRMGIEWLAVMVAHWCQRLRAEKDLTLGFLSIIATGIPDMLKTKALGEVVDMALLDLPTNLALFSAKEKISAKVANHMNRLLTFWTDQGVEKNILAFLRQATVACQSNLSNEDGFTSLASATLLSMY
jgi:hypothetical protein